MPSCRCDLERTAGACCLRQAEVKVEIGILGLESERKRGSSNVYLGHIYLKPS